MESGAVNSFHVIVKQITKFDGRKAGAFLEWDFKLRASLGVSNKTTSTSYKGRSGRQMSMPTRRLLA